MQSAILPLLYLVSKGLSEEAMECQVKGIVISQLMD